MYSVIGDTAYLTISAGIYTGDLSAVLTANGYDPNTHNLSIRGASAATTTWVDFQFNYSTHGRPDKLQIQNITLSTDNIDGYAVYSRDSKTTMTNVNITGYSGDTTLISDVADGSGRWSETGGGAMRIRDADYTSESHSASNPSLQNVNVTNCCRGIRLQDLTSIYVKNCSVYNLSDNGIYFAASTYDSSSGCEDCTVDSCTVTLVGQTGLMNIGGNNNTFTNCTVNNTRGAGGAVYNTNGTITYHNCSFTNVNTVETTTPWGGNTDDFQGAAFGKSVAVSDTTADVIIKNSTFVGVGSGNYVYYISSTAGTLTYDTNTDTNFAGTEHPASVGVVTIIP